MIDAARQEAFLRPPASLRTNTANGVIVPEHTLPAAVCPGVAGCSSKLDWCFVGDLGSEICYASYLTLSDEELRGVTQRRPDIANSSG